MDDDVLRRLAIDRIYDTYIDEDQLRICDATCGRSPTDLSRALIRSREFIREMGRYLTEHAKNRDSVVLSAFEKGVPIFVPAFSDCSAGFGLIHHQMASARQTSQHRFSQGLLELTKIKIDSKQSGLFMIGGGVPKNFAKTRSWPGIISVSTSACTNTRPDYGGRRARWRPSGSTLKEANSWGKVDQGAEQMVLCRSDASRCRSSPGMDITKARGKIARRAITQHCLIRQLASSGDFQIAGPNTQR